ncbi:serine/threonine-protein kinase [Micromonospora sp. URMC 105]|uniref:serine/threonine-protein kinase n=1 Tax=Micromonospora sp. URMC 105 TaxID=3423413 RepID=UPI003F1B73D1
MLTQGVVLSDRYRLGERVATGGMGAVWRCVDTLLDREVAVKVLLPALVEDPEFTTRFHAEARMMAALRHPGIVAVHDFGSATLADGSQVSYLVMEYVDGEPLVTWIRRAGRLDPASTMSVVAQAAAALHAAHTAGIVHRDVKPGNLLVKRDGTVVLVDFGIARSSTMASLTAAHMVLGTASYMSPEQAVGQPVSAATDVYALGAVAYYCLTGQPPFVGENPLQVALRHAQEEPAPLPPGTPPAVAEVVGRALAKSPGDRWPSAAALADAALDARDATLAVLRVPPRPPWALAGPVLPAPTGPSTPPSAETSSGSLAAASSARPSPAPPAGHPGRYVVPETTPTREDPAGGAARRRRLALAGAAGGVVAVLAAVAAVVALQPDEPARGGPAALTAESAAAVPGTPGPVAGSRTGKPRPSASTARSSSAGPTGTSSPRPGVEPDAGASTTAVPQPGTTTTAPAKSNPYTPGQVCGSGYQVIDSAALKSDGVQRGKVYLLWNDAAKANCVATMKVTAVGERTTVSAFLQVQGKTRATDSGAFEYYAGPVRAGAGGTCVKWGGSAGGAGYASEFEHCG